MALSVPVNWNELKFTSPVVVLGVSWMSVGAKRGAPSSAPLMVIETSFAVPSSEKTVKLSLKDWLPVKALTVGFELSSV
ncbi:hypothetical protein EOA50_01975 [Mesorhizobium sp. M1A.F.Ca.IN.020.30.1.1]|nr:hypothetical protein EOA50_01975 [Mesorhizobium sp. M1A.F.Ca.IN.020.30.1.1]